MPSKPEILRAIERARPDLQHEEAAKYGGVLLDLSCKSRRCDGKLLRQWIEIPKVEEPNLAMEVRFVQCPKCGVKGAWNIVESPEPNPAVVAKAKAEEASEREQARKDEIKSIDAQIAMLQERRDVLDPPVNPSYLLSEHEVMENAEPTAKA